ncbi:kinase-like protein [Massarina eburnea CBS 473.64]|uniref:non-specific serine/threonine protein kinase n=1 Tax=Massarina eburnea CBS 473.64 TaxID=1395130 RepID=A0A6A6RMA8_9PLEO|nr:kinase-like protein [Massarina eburnea CBS 473.64]
MPFGLHLHRQREVRAKWVRKTGTTHPITDKLFLESLASDFPKRYTRIQKVGDGSEGCVESWAHKGSGAMIAAKVIRARQSMPREVEVLKDLPPHKSIAQILAYFQKMPKADSDCVLFEYCAGGDLFDLQRWMWKKNRCLWSEAFMWAIFTQLGDAMAFLHEGQGCPGPHDADLWRPVVHRDVKMENVFIDALGAKDDCSSVKVKLGDFGLSTFYNPKDPKMPGHWGTTILWPPEQTWEGREATPAGDIWAVGCIIHELAHGFPPVVDPEKTESEYKSDPKGGALPVWWDEAKKKTFWAANAQRKPFPINLNPTDQEFDGRRNRPTPKYSNELNGCLQMALAMNMENRATAGALKEALEEQEAAYKYEEMRKMTEAMEIETGGDGVEEDWFY